MRVTVLVTEREYATLKRACGGHGVASLLVRGGLREAAAMTERLHWCPVCEPQYNKRASVLSYRGCAACRAQKRMDAQDPSATLAGALLDGATPERLAWLAGVGEALTVTSGLRVGKSAAIRKVVAKAKAAGVRAKVVRR